MPEEKRISAENEGSKREEQAPPPGFKLRHKFSGHKAQINRIAWSPNGRMLASPSDDETIRIWDTQTGELKHVLQGHSHFVYSVSWSPDGRALASGSVDQTIRLWNTASGRQGSILTGQSPAHLVVAWSPDGRTLASGGNINTVKLWDAISGRLRQEVVGPFSYLKGLTWSPDSKSLAAGGLEGSVVLWDARAQPLRRLPNTYGISLTIAWSPDGQRVAVGYESGIIQLWDAQARQEQKVLEGHTDFISCVSFSSDGRLLASKAADGTVRLWRCDTWETVTILAESASISVLSGLAFHPSDSTILATLGQRDTTIRIWDLDIDTILATPPRTKSVHYMTAKIALVGESGVGKTGLGWRLAHGSFKEQSSTHGQQFWVIDKLGGTRADGTECEVMLWDLAGQPDYRLVHALFLDDVDEALVLFDPASQQEPLKGVEYWLKQFAHRQWPSNAILVGARADRGTPTLTQAEIAAFCRRHHIADGYISTSARSGTGLNELIERIKAVIDWDARPATVTTETFKRIKEYVLVLKADPECKAVLVDSAELRRRLEATDSDWAFGDDEMMTAVGHLANHGYMTILRGSCGERTILLTPELLTNLASSIVLEARRNPTGLGALDETQLLQGSYPLQEFAGLEQRERNVLLDAATALFLKHTLCFRETLGAQTFLVFPALINQKRPQNEESGTIDDVAYHVSGAVENVYAALVVLLGYTNIFTHTNHWQNRAQYEMEPGQICGFRQIDEREGEVELILYYAEQTPPHVRLLFEGLFERFLRARDVIVTKYPPVNCSECGYRQERGEVMKRIRAGKSFLFCGECGERIVLPCLEEENALDRRDRAKLDQEQARTRQRTAFETALVRIKAVVRDRGQASRAPNCFISYAWGDAVHERWVIRLATDLQNAGVAIVLDRRDNARIGANIGRFISRIEESRSDYVVVVGTPLYRRKYENKLAETGSVAAAEVDLINLRLIGTEAQKDTVLPLLLDGDERDALPPLMRGRVYADFRQESRYFAALFDLILTLYGIPFTQPAIADLRDGLHGGERMW